MRFWAFLILAVVASAAALPVEDASQTEVEVTSDAYIIDKIIDVERLKTILRELLEHGKTIGKSTLEQLMKIANGAAKEMLAKLIENLNKNGQGSTYAIGNIVDPEQMKKILQELLEHGKTIGKAVIEQLLKIAQGAARDMLVKILEKLGNNQGDAYILGQIGIDQAKIKEVLNLLKEHGKAIAIDALKKMLETAKGAFKQLLAKLMEQLIEEEILGDAYIIDKIIDVERLKTILRELLEHGKTIGKATLEQLMKIANGAAKEMLAKLLEQINKNGQGSTYALGTIVDPEQMKKVLQELLEHGKTIGKAVIQQLLKIAQGAARDMLVKILENLGNNQGDAYILGQIGIDQAKIKEVLNLLKEHGKAIAIDALKKIMETAKGAFKQLLAKLMEQLIEEEIAGDAYIIDKIIDVDRLKTILRELLEHGKTIGKATLEQLMKIASGAAKEMLAKLLEQINKNGQLTVNDVNL